MITIISLLLSAICIILLVVLLLRKTGSGNEVTGDLNNFRNEMLVQMRDNRSELNTTINDFRKELRESVQSMNDQNRSALEKLGEVLESRLTALINKNDEQLEKVNLKLEQKLEQVNAQTRDENKTLRESQEKSLREFQERFDKNVTSFNDLQREKFSQLDKQQKELILSTENKLEQMRVTVDEKLQKTLNERLGQSFELVSKQLGEVQKGLGEMQTLAQDVGGLKKVLSNVKTRGGIGEVQLSMLLEQILAPEQYQANVKTKAGSSELVEFAIKLPGSKEDGTPMWLPVDAKFPQDMFARLQDAYESGDAAAVDKESKALETTIKNMAKDIRDKYIDPPNTTDFAIMFLPFENIYAEVIRKAGFVDLLMREYRIVVTGPTTFAAILNSLQMGFRTLAIQKRSSEVWQILKAVKTEFANFSTVLTKAQEKILSANEEIEKLVTTRTRKIQLRLNNVETLNESDADKILGEGNPGSEPE